MREEIRNAESIHSNYSFAKLRRLSSEMQLSKNVGIKVAEIVNQKNKKEFHPINEQQNNRGTEILMSVIK